MLERIGKYEIRLQIGRGAMGVVYEGFDPAIGRRVAIKMLRTEMFEPSQLPDILARFKREAQSAGRLSHPHIVTIHDYGEEQGAPYIVMEYMSGDELGRQLERGSRFSTDEVVRIMTALLGALAHAHEHGVIHRDLKPANMFVLKDGSLKVVDFGIARVEASDLTETGTTLGTPAYMSPEQFLALQVDARSDIYSAGVILYQLLTGDKPFTGTITAIMQKVLHQHPIEPSVLNPTLSKAWDAVVARAMAKKPEARYETARQFLEAVTAAHSAERESRGAPGSKTVRLDARGEAERTIPLRRPDPTATVLGRPTPTEGRSREAGEPRRSRKSIALAALLLAALGIAAAFFYPRGDSPELAKIERARQDAERRAADAEERASREAQARAKAEAARDEDLRREADAAKARARKDAERSKQEAEAKAKAEADRREEERRREAEAAKARAAEIARKEAEERTRLAALKAEETKRKAAATLAKKEAEDRVRADAARKAEAAKKAEEARKADKARAEQALRDKYKAGTVLRDCPDCPQMVVIPAGEFTMGSPASEAERFEQEGPQRAVRIALFSLGRNEVTFAEFERFVAEAAYKTDAERDSGKGCFGFNFIAPGAAKDDWQPGRSWRDPGIDQNTERDPVVCVSWNDAKAYASWLSKKTGKIYRLPTEAEWEYAARAGTRTARYWGDDPNHACVHENAGDQSTYRTAFRRTFSRSKERRHECNDGRYFTAPVASYRANGFGLYDMLGNVWEWTEDCWNASYQGAPADGSARLTGDCSRRVLRGGNWGSEPRRTRSAYRDRGPSDYRATARGFRVARTLE